MVKTGAIISCLLALGLVDPSSAGYNRTDQTVTYVPLFDEWTEEGTGANVNMTTTFDLVNSAYAHLYDTDDSADDLAKRTSITVVVERTLIVGGTVLLGANAGITAWQTVAAIIKNKAEEKSCTLTYGADTTDDQTIGYAYEATTTETVCGSTAEKKTVLKAVKKCANNLHNAGATRGCCKFRHGDGSWTGHLRLTAEPEKYPATTVDC
ncbi:hypothetical protein N7540_010928 [Penicillium herquei]|nr:hypothetical protein N7540_010928 [Penicillium herquei]